MSRIDSNSIGKSLYKDDYCYGFGCFNRTTEKIDVSAGSFGIITLQLCKNCIKKFQNKQGGS